MGRMKKVRFRDRKVAVIITVIIMVLSTGYGAHRSLLQKAETVETIFYYGENGDGVCIQSDLDTRLGLASNLLIVAGRYLSEDDEAMERLTAARTALATAKTIEEKYRANEELTLAADYMDQVLQACVLTPSDNRYRAGIRTDMDAVNQIIGHDGYNDAANAYNRDVLGVFPANVLKEIVMVDELETFN